MDVGFLTLLMVISLVFGAVTLDIGPELSRLMNGFINSATFLALLYIGHRNQKTANTAAESATESMHMLESLKADQR